ncbi:alpha/beta hydrolase [Lachnospiraceae bacterium ZAX-1]
MSNKKLIKKALRFQRMMKIFIRVQTLKAKTIGTKRFIDTSYGKIKVLEYGFDSPQAAPLFVDMHSAGFVLGSAEMDDQMCRYFNAKTGVKIINIDYPKSPKNQFPIAIEAAYEVILHYVNNDKEYKIDIASVGVGGHSAGGNMAAALCLKAKELGELSFKYQILDYPPLDITIDPYERVSPQGAISPKMMEMFNVSYLGEDWKNQNSIYASPILASQSGLAGLPPALIIVAGRDSLHDDGVRYAELLRKAGVYVELRDFKDSFHGFTYNKTPDAKEGRDVIVEFLKRHI